MRIVDSGQAKSSKILRDGRERLLDYPARASPSDDKDDDNETPSVGPTRDYSPFPDIYDAPFLSEAEPRPARSGPVCFILSVKAFVLMRHHRHNLIISRSGNHI